MKTIFYKQFLLLAIILSAGNFEMAAQKQVYLQDQQEITKAAIDFLDGQMKNELLLWAQKHVITGSYLCDITLRKKGEVATVFVARGNGEIKHQNALKDYVYDLKFPLKLPKGKSYKFSYEFNL